MNRKRFVYWLISIIVTLALIIYIWFSDDEYYMFYTLLGMGLIFPNFTFKKIEKRKLMEIIVDYSQTGNVKKYLDSLSLFNKKMVKNKKNKYFDLISYAHAYMDMGNFEGAKDILDKLVEEEPRFTSLIRFFYYRAWINYFLNYGLDGEAKKLLDQLKAMIELAAPQLRQQYIINYQILVAKYNIRCDVLLIETKATLKQIIDANPTPLMTASTSYYVGIIEYKLGNFSEAKSIFNEVAKFNEQLHFVVKAKEYLHRLSE
ncbi:MAG TPA: tetratricopeptide repeat protein [Bacilli bacterium]|nr:tetratricopeptide repeat protein [Bacilli bacterium]